MSGIKKPAAGKLLPPPGAAPEEKHRETGSIPFPAEEKPRPGQKPQHRAGGGNHLHGQQTPSGAGKCRGRKEQPFPKNTGSLGSLQNTGRRKRLIAAGVLFFLLLTAAGVLFYISRHYHVETIYVDGNVHYTNEEIIEMVTSEKLGDNSLYLSLKYKNKGIKGIPFIEKMDVKVLAPDTIKIVVYEKAVAGYVEYLDKYMYFDKDGTVVEASDTKTAGIPQVTGIPFDQVVLYEPLPVENQEVFKEILYMTQILSKYEISADKIYFDDAYEMTLYFGDVRVKLGNDDNVEEKISRLKQILPAAEGKKGVFRMENYAGSGSNVSFEQDK